MRGSLLPRILVLCLCVGLLAAPVFAGADPYDAIERALKLAASGEVDAARAALPHVANAEEDPLSRMARGAVELYAKNLPVAETTFRAVLGRDPDCVPALWGLSLCLLQRNHVFEAAALIDRAAALAPADTRIKTMQAYTACLLNRVSDAAAAGKAALDAGEKSPFLLATLAMVQRRMGYAQKALEFGGFAARAYYGMDFLAPTRPVALPLTMVTIDTPVPKLEPAVPTGAQRTDIELDAPKPGVRPADRPLRIAAPIDGSTVRGMQRVQVAFRNPGEMKFLVFLVDGVLRGMITELPYHFTWDSDAAAAGEHTLTVRAFSGRHRRSGAGLAARRSRCATAE